MPVPADPLRPDVVLADGWFPVGLWLGPQTCLVRTDEGPDPGVVEVLVGDLAAQGLHPIPVAEDLQAAILGVTMQRVDVIAGLWDVWSVDEATARTAITAAATG